MGERVLIGFQEILSTLDSMEDDLHTIENESYGKLRIGFHGPAEWADIPELIKDFKEHHPSVECEIVIDFWNVLRDKVMDGEVDIAFIELSEVDGMAALDSKKLFTEHLCIVTRFDHPLTHKRVVSVDDITTEKVVLPDYGITPRYFQRFRRVMERAGLSVTKAGQGNYSEATITLAAAGAGITVMPRSFKTASNAVRYIDLDMPENYLDMGVVWSRSSTNPLVVSFADFCARWTWSDN